MGRKTFASLKRPLPGRANIVLTRDRQLHVEGVEVFYDVTEVLQRLGHEPQSYIIGGAEIYRLFMPVCDRVLLTRVHAEIDGDTRIDPLEETQWRCDSVEAFPAGVHDEFATSLETWLRVERR
jgi:dihydrofolate reductase